MFQAKLIRIDKLGEPKEPYPQSWWGEIADDLTPIMIFTNDELSVGDNIEYEGKEMKKSAKGTVYFKLNKVKVVNGDVSEPVNKAQSFTTDSAPSDTTQLEAIAGPTLALAKAVKEGQDRLETSLQELHSKVDKLLGWDDNA